MASATWEVGRRVFAVSGWQDKVRCGHEFPCFEKESPPLNPATGHKRDWNK